MRRGGESSETVRSAEFGGIYGFVIRSCIRSIWGACSVPTPPHGGRMASRLPHQRNLPRLHIPTSFQACEVDAR